MEGYLRTCTREGGGKGRMGSEYHLHKYTVTSHAVPNSAPASTMSPSRFIDDLIPLILQADDHWWPRDLVALAALSSSWHFFVSKRLYTYPIIHSFPAACLLARTLAENSFLASIITGICLRPVVKAPSRCPKFAELKAVRQLLALEGLARISIGGELAVNAERFLKFIAYPDILQELHVDGTLLDGRLTSCPSLEWDDSLAFAYPELRKLRLTSLELDISPPSSPYASTISSLVVENVHILNGHLSHLVNGAEALDRLHITTNDPTVCDDEIRLMLASCAVGCLHYDMKKDCNTNRLLLEASSESLASLRCLHLDGLFVDALVLRTLEETCHNLVELVVSGRAVRVSVQEWVNFICSDGFKSLRRLGLPWGTNSPPFSAWIAADTNAIRDACATRKSPLSIL